MNRITTGLNHPRRALAALAASAACLIGAAGSASAANPAVAGPSVTVTYGDLNLASTQGQDVLYARIEAAARRVCAVEDVDIRDLERFNLARACEARALAQAVHSLQVAAVLDAREPHG
jgi:UrcA family protein